MLKKPFLPYLEVLFSVVVWGVSFVATKYAITEVAPITVIWLRFSMGIIILGAAVRVRRQFLIPRGREWIYFSLLGFLGITFHTWLQSKGLVTAQATTTAWIVASIPIFIALLGWIFLKEKLKWVGYLGILLAAAGVMLVVSKGDWQTLSLYNLNASGDLLIMLSAPNWAVFSILSRRGLQKYPAAGMVFWVMTLGWLFSSVVFLLDSGFPEIIHLTWQGWLAVGFLGVFCSGLGYIAWYDGLQHLPATQVGGFLYLEPLVTMFVAALFLGETVTWISLLGGAVILSGVWLVNSGKKPET